MFCKSLRYLNRSIVEYSYIPTSVPVFSLLQYVILIEVSERNLALHKYAVGEGNISVAFSDIVDTFPLLLHPNLTNGISMNFLYSVVLKSISLSCTLNGSYTHTGFYSILLWSFGKYWFT